MSTEWSPTFKQLLRITAKEAFDPKKQRDPVIPDTRRGGDIIDDDKYAMIATMYGEGGREGALRDGDEGTICFTSIAKLFISRWNEDERRMVNRFNHLTQDGRVLEHGSGDRPSYLNDQMMQALLDEVAAFTSGEVL